jgi:hypothetical protein
MNDITVILNGYLRPEFLSTQLDAIHNQTIQPKEIMLWQNSSDGFEESITNKLTTVKSNKNLGVWARFAFALNAKTEYICIFDDDTIPGKKWLENCLETIKTHEGLLGTIGLVYDSPHNYLEHTRYGWDNPNEETVRVDIVGHCWFFKREWLSAFWREFAPVEYSFVGEDMFFSYAIQKYLGLNTYVPPHPKNDKDMWGSTLGWQCGNVKPTSAIPGRISEMNSFYCYLIQKGFEIINSKNNVFTKKLERMENIKNLRLLNYEVLEFRKININDISDNRFNDGYAWSRVYEYPLVIETIKKYYGDNKDIFIHNTSWGFQGVHVIFKNLLDSEYKNTVHSDILHSDLPKTFIYDITNKPTEDNIEKFDVVLNVSTVEEVSDNHFNILHNLFNQVKKGGLLVITFDLPGLQIDDFELMLDKKLKVSENDISGSNSILINPHCSNLNCGILIIKKQ